MSSRPTGSGLHFTKCATPFCAQCTVINCHPVHNYATSPTPHLHTPKVHPSSSSYSCATKPICSGLLFLKLLPLSIKRTSPPNSFSSPSRVGGEAWIRNAKHPPLKEEEFESRPKYFLCVAAVVSWYGLSIHPHQSDQDAIANWVHSLKWAQRTFQICRNFSSIKLC